MHWHTQHFITMARRAHREGMKLRRAGLYALAFAKFAERDVQLERAKP